MNPEFIKRVKKSFKQQKFMGFIGAKLTNIQPGLCEIQVPFKKELTQQNGFFHAGIVGTLADNTGGYAAFSLMKPDDSVLTVEYKLNLLSPAKGETLIARSKVLKAGKKLTVCFSEVFVKNKKVEKLCATALVTLISLRKVKV